MPLMRKRDFESSRNFRWPRPCSALIGCSRLPLSIISFVVTLRCFAWLGLVFGVSTHLRIGAKYRWVNVSVFVCPLRRLSFVPSVSASILREKNDIGIDICVVCLEIQWRCIIVILYEHWLNFSMIFSWTSVPETACVYGYYWTVLTPWGDIEGCNALHSSWPQEIHLLLLLFW